MDSNSVKQFLDLNRCSKISGTTLLLPKIEPVVEPFEEPLPPQPLVCTPNPCANPTPIPTSILHSDFNNLVELFQTAVAQASQSYSDISDLSNSDPNSRAIVLVSTEPHISNIISTPYGSRKHQARSSEMVRVMDLKSDDQLYYRNLIRRTRMMFDSLRVFEIAKDHRPRADLKAATLMRERGLWLYRDQRIIGEIPGISIGDVFSFRTELCVVGLHGHPQAGIDYVPSKQSPSGEPIATSIIFSGGYEDDEDAGDMIIYTGHGGREKHNRQVEHQKLECGNLALERSMNYGIEVRVIRGLKCEGSTSGKVYVYDGLYKIIETWFAVGKSGFGVFKFKLVRNENQGEMGSAIMKLACTLRTQPMHARPKGYITLDLSEKKEKFPVFLYNDVDGNHEPIYYDYLITSAFPPHVYNGNTSGCNCVGGCLENCFCAIRNGGEFAYDLNGILVRGKPLIFECGPHCHCPPTCRNRVTQKGVRNQFEVFRSTDTHWGLRSLDLIQAGSFICEYAGVVLTREQVPIFTMNGDNLIYPNRFAKRWKEWGDLSQVFSDNVCPTYPSIPPLDFAIDVSCMRNVACYMSHSSTPNVMVQFVLYDHNNVFFPHLMLFALENIPPMRELSLDYGVVDE